MTKLDNDVVSRMLVEYQELDAKIQKLEKQTKDFRGGKNKYTDIAEIHLLEEQLHYMNGYRRLLKIRLYQQNVTEV